MGHPSEYYVKFLLSRSWSNPEDADTAGTINHLLSTYDFPPLTDDHYNNIVSVFEPHDGFRFSNRSNPDVAAFMREEKIYSLWSPTPEDSRVIPEILEGHQHLRLTINLLLMGGLPNFVIAEKVNERYLLTPPITERMVALYRHYFWNVSNTSQEEWALLLNGSKFQDAYLSALHCGEQQAMFRAGFRPRVEGRVALMDAYRQVHFRLQSTQYWPDSKFTVSTISTLVSKLTALHEVLYAEGAGAEDLLKKFRSVVMKNRKTDAVSIDDVVDKTKGSFSNDGSKETIQ